MQLLDIVSRQIPPKPWAEGDNIPWHEPGFSERMLREHLSQEHDAASRRLAIVEKQVEWMHKELLRGKATRILDLGCGPGLYTGRLAKRGHECTGIDYSPASIRYAREAAEKERLRCTYRLEDIRQADYGSDLGLVMLIFGEFNVLSPADAAALLDKAQRALRPGGLLLLEPHSFAAVRKLGKGVATWRSLKSGLFSARPHLLLEERSWDGRAWAATVRYYVVDAETGEVTQHASSQQAYTDDEYRAVLGRHGFPETRFFPSLGGISEGFGSELIAIVARKG